MLRIRYFILLIAVLTLPLHGIWYDVCIDPGHCGAADPGAPGVNGDDEPNESDFNLYMGLVCEADLIEMGWSVILTRHTETYWPYRSPNHKAETANGERKNDYGHWTEYPVGRAVSIHCNSSVDETAHGTETYYKFHEDFAQSVQDGAYNYLQMFPNARDRGIFQAPTWGWLRCTRTEACLIEVAFVSHNVGQNSQWLQLRDNQGGFKDYAALGIDEGITGMWVLHAPPTNLRLIWESYQRGSAKFVWHPTTTQGVTYSIYRREYPNPNFVLIASGYEDTIYTDNTVTGGKIYLYYVQAVSGTQTSPRSHQLIVQTPPFSTNFAQATGSNCGRRIIFDDNGISNLTYSTDTSFWYTQSSDYGNAWSPSQLIKNCFLSNIACDGLDNYHIVSAGFSGMPDTASGEDSTFVIAYSQYPDSILRNPSLYESDDSISSISFDIGPLDTGWVVFSTYEDNSLMIGKFYTQDAIEDLELEDIVVLDNNVIKEGTGSIVVRPSDRSLHVVYERSNGFIYYLKRDNLGNWSSPLKISKGHNPSISIAGDLIHFIWESWYSWYTRIHTCYTNGVWWSRIEDISGAINGEGCYPYLEQGAVATWSQEVIQAPPDQESPQRNYWEVYESHRTLTGGWTTPQNMSQSTVDSRYPQSAMFQTLLDTRVVGVWTEGNSAPYEVKILPVTAMNLSAPIYTKAIPLYAFNLGENEPSVFCEHRSGYINYGQGFTKSVDYDTSFLSYKITGLDSSRIYHFGLIFYQDENNSTWQQGIEIDNVLIKTANVPRRKVVYAIDSIPAQFYKDGIVDLRIRKQSGSRAILAILAVWEFSRDGKPTSSIEEFKADIPKQFEAFSSPNPAKGKSLIHYQLPRSAEITVKIYSITGRLIREIQEKKPAGTHTIIWDGKDNNYVAVASGIYFYSVESLGESKKGKIIYLR